MYSRPRPLTYEGAVIVRLFFSCVLATISDLHLLHGMAGMRISSVGKSTVKFCPQALGRL